MMYRTDEDLERLARAFLRTTGLEDQVKPDMMTIISKLKHLDPSFGYRRVPDVEMPDADARWYSDVTEISMRRERLRRDAAR